MKAKKIMGFYWLQMRERQRACSQMSKSRSESRFESHPASWLCSWLELHAFTSITTECLSSWSRIGSAYCEVISCSYCTDWPLHDFSMHFQNAHAWITLRKELCLHKSSEWGFLGGPESKTPLFSHFKSLIWKSFACTKCKVRFSNQERLRITIWSGFRNVIRPFVNRPRERERERETYDGAWNSSIPCAYIKWNWGIAL